MKTILVPTDYSDNARHALRFALYLNENTPFHIVLLHLGEILVPTSTPQHLYKEMYEKHVETMLNELKNESNKVLQNMELPNSGKHIEHILKDGGDLVDAVLETVNEKQVDLILMGTCGASGLKKFFLGSNTAHIIEKANVPVLAIPENYHFAPVKKIAYASDLKEVIEEVKDLVPFAKLFDASIDIFHVYPSYPQWVDPSKENLEKITKKLETTYHGQKFHLHVVQTYKENEVVYGIEKFVKSFKPDILAMFTVKRNFFDKIFDGSLTEEVACSTSIPLLTLKKD